ncbi:MAG: hypothetical protein LBU65_05185 [Planctomycetaceae bacterium]|jgi:hypothetical protein|nr:hypothetical protein [Planctomycetaceae bacterium]
MLRNIERLGCAAFFSLVAFTCGVVTCSAADSEAVKVAARLEKIWNVQQKEIVTAHIMFRKAQGSTKGRTRPLTNEQIDNIVSQVDFSVPEKAFAELVSKLLNLKQESIIENELFWSPPKYLVKSRIMESNRRSDSLNLQHHTILSDGENRMIVDPLNTQVDISVASGVIDEIGMLRTVPGLKLSKGTFRYTLSGDQIAIDSENSVGWVNRYLIDVNTGLAVDSFSHQTGSGHVGRGRYQRCFFTSAKSIEFPRIAVQVEYQDHISILTTIIIIDEASFNTSIPDDTYKLALPNGMNVFDARRSGPRPDYIGLKEPTNDVISLISPVVQPSTTSVVVRSVCIVGGILLILIAIIMKIYNFRVKKR